MRSCSQQHQYYDEYIANWDDEVGRLFDYLNESGLRENSYIVITADHGELFERGELGHKTRLLYDGVVHVPLIILSPGPDPAPGCARLHQQRGPASHPGAPDRQSHSRVGGGQTASRAGRHKKMRSAASFRWTPAPIPPSDR